MTQAARVHFFREMPKDDELLRRALAHTPEEQRDELRKALREMRARLAEGGTPEQLEARRQQIAAAERALARVDEQIFRAGTDNK